MTREEAINILNRDDDDMRKGYFCINDFLAIEVLKSEESILDKIRVEIIQLIQNGVLKIESGNEALFNIIDKYKAESEEV